MIEGRSKKERERSRQIEDGPTCGWVREVGVGEETRENRRSCGWCEARIQAVVDQNIT